jgi:hypothetical protein
MRAVNHRRRVIEGRLSKTKPLERLLKRRPIPTVFGPAGELFIVDCHHFALALWQAQVDWAYLRIIDDASTLKATAFWRHMEAKGWFYPFDEIGRPIAPAELPIWLHALRHDPYRDLAWAVREAGGFEKVTTPFSEFRWANFFREHISLATVRRDHNAAIGKALKLCRSKAAAALPGHIVNLTH